MKNTIIGFIKDETNDLLDEPQVLTKESRLFGEDGVLDSMGLVSMIIAVEQAIEDEYDISITIANAKAMSRKNSPFATVNALADYIVELIEAENE